MRRQPPPTPPGAEVLQAGGRGGTGNFLYLFRNETPPVVLKVYRYRRSRLREFLKNFSERALEGKRGATAAIRCATEKLSLDLWAREGFDVIQRIERPLPAGVTSPALWLTYYEATNLGEVLADPGHGLEAKLRLCEALGASLSRRHTRAVELQEPLLIHEHGNVKHFLVTENRLIAFDLEHGFKPGFPLVEAITRELAGVAQSLARADLTAADRFLSAFVAGYTNKNLLKQAIQQSSCGGGLAGKIRRWRERRRDSKHGKTRVMERLGKLLGA
ncbi:MAG: hypothetical protein MUF81_07460 [Verrucomicrobia bacterium]|jgi:hypothetical protein|nr:hypothetical protein [Verrucomicrobiota bacterium]